MVLRKYAQFKETTNKKGKMQRRDVEWSYSGTYSSKLASLEMWIYAIVTSRLDYCNALCMGLPLKSTWKLWLI